MAREIVELFLQDAPRHVAAILEAAEETDASALERAAHTLKSTSAQMGAEALSALCKELEAAGRSGDVDDVLESALQVEVEYERVRQALETARYEAA